MTCLAADSRLWSQLAFGRLGCGLGAEFIEAAGVGECQEHEVFGLKLPQAAGDAGRLAEGVMRVGATAIAG